MQNIVFFMVDYESWNLPPHKFLTTMQYMVCVWKYTQGMKNHGIKPQYGSDMVQFYPVVLAVLSSIIQPSVFLHLSIALNLVLPFTPFSNLSQATWARSYSADFNATSFKVSGQVEKFFRWQSQWIDCSSVTYSVFSIFADATQQNKIQCSQIKPDNDWCTKCYI